MWLREEYDLDLEDDSLRAMKEGAGRLPMLVMLRSAGTLDNFRAS